MNAFNQRISGETHPETGYNQTSCSNWLRSRVEENSQSTRSHALQPAATGLERQPVLFLLRCSRCDSAVEYLIWQNRYAFVNKSFYANAPRGIDEGHRRRSARETNHREMCLPSKDTQCHEAIVL
jgi:hypothetical protein